MKRKQRSRNAKSLRATRGGSQLRKTNRAQYNVQPQTGVFTMLKSPRAVMPSTLRTHCKYIVQDIVANVGGVAASIRFRNEAYDVDPAVASTAMPGFGELAQIYSRYRTLGIGYKFSAANQEAFSLTVIHGFSGSSIASGSLSITYAGNPFFNTNILGPLTGQNRGVFRGNRSVRSITGTDQPIFDDIYTGSTTSATLPTAGTVYCYFGIITPVVMTAAGVLVTVEVTLDLEFYRPNFLTS